jgi:hypothetical protein
MTRSNIKNVVKTGRIQIMLTLVAAIIAGCSAGTSDGDTTSSSASETVITQTESPLETTSTTVDSPASTLPAELTWPSEPSIVGHVTEVDVARGFAVVGRPSGISVGPATITIDGEIELELKAATPTNRECELLKLEEAPDNAPPGAPQRVFPCLVLVNASGSTVEQLHVLEYERLSRDSEARPTFFGPVHEIRDDLALVDTGYGVFTVPITDEVDTSACFDLPFREIPQEDELFTQLYLNEGGQIEAVSCLGAA